MKSSPDPEPQLFPPGTVLRPKAVGAHAFVVLGNSPDQLQILTAAWTSLDEECPDDECQLGPDDHAEISHRSALALSRARLWDAGKLRQAIAADLIQIRAPLGLGSLKRILLDALQSRNLRREWKTLLPLNPS